MRRAKLLPLLLCVAAVQLAAGAGTAAASPQGPGDVGRWSAPIDVGVIGIHAALLPTGEVLLYEYPFDQIGSEAHVIDPVTGENTDVSLRIRRNIFCSGHSLLPDGRVLAVGGEKYDGPGFNGIRAVTIYDPQTQTWTDGNAMFKARWYPTPVQMPDGTTLVLSGLAADGETLVKRMESYDPDTEQWTLLPRSANSDSDLYPRMFVMPDGSVFRAGPNQEGVLFHPDSNSWSFVDNMNGGWRSFAGAVLLPEPDTTKAPERVFVAGGWGPLDSTEIIDLSDATPQWTFSDGMHHARYNHNTVLLADGSILAVGGGQGPNLYDNPVRQAELYDPATGLWRDMASQAANRTYHSTALLLPDGRVVSAGSDGGDMPRTIEYYSPPYLFQGARPTISSAPASIAYGQAFSIGTPNAGAITRAALVRLGSTTHANNFEQRYADLAFSAGGGQLNATAPAGPELAPPGHYMLFLLNSAGVPSVAKILRLG